MSNLNHIPSRFVSWVDFFLLNFNSSLFDMRNVQLIFDSLLRRFSGISFVSAKILNCLGTFDNNCIKPAASWLTSCRFAPVTTIESGTPRSSTRRCLLLPFFSPVCRVATNALLSKGSFNHCAIYALPTPGYAFHVIVLCKTRSPKCKEKACTLPSCKMSVDCAGTAESLFG